jgi:hypothetical protein
MVNKIRLTAALIFTDCPLVIADFLVFDGWGLRHLWAAGTSLRFGISLAPETVDHNGRLGKRGAVAAAALASRICPKNAARANPGA